MNEILRTRLLDRELVVIIERLSVDFVELPVNAVASTVHELAFPHRGYEFRNLRSVAAQVEDAARRSLSAPEKPSAA